MLNLTNDHISRIEEQLGDMGYIQPEFNTIDEHPEYDTVMVWFQQDKPNAPYQYVLARLDFASNRPPYMEII